MQKFGEGQARHDPEDPQGVPVPGPESLFKEASASDAEALRRENDDADAAPETESTEG